MFEAGMRGGYAEGERCPREVEQELSSREGPRRGARELRGELGKVRGAAPPGRVGECFGLGWEQAGGRKGREINRGEGFSRAAQKS